MAYNLQLSNRVRQYLADVPSLEIEEKRMFGGLAFMVNGKMCINISGNNLMCRFDPDRLDELSNKVGFVPVIMKNRQLKGYCYVVEEGYQNSDDFNFWVQTCLDYNPIATASKKS